MGAEFQVNTHTAGMQSIVDVAGAPPAASVVTWASFAQDGDFWGVFARRYDSGGNAVGSDFQVSVSTSAYQYQATVAHHPTNGFLVTWVNAYIDADVLARRLDANGNPQGAELQVNTMAGYNGPPVAAAGASGEFLVAWTGTDSSASGIFARRLDSAGIPQGTPFQVNVYTPGPQYQPSVAAAAGGFIVTWTGSDSNGRGVFARRHDSTGLPVGSEFLVNAHTLFNQSDSQIAADAAGNFVVVWSDSAGDGGDAGIFARLFDSTGGGVGSDFQVSGYTIANQQRAAVAMSPAGDFVITWDDDAAGLNKNDVFARAFHRTGQPDGDAVQVNVYTSAFQVFPQIAAGSGGIFHIVWESALQDGSLNGIFSRRFVRAGTPASGKKLLIRTPPDASKRKLVFISADASMQVPANVGEDPRCPPLGSGTITAGATLRVAGAGGDFAIDLPCLNWTASSGGERYRYRDATGGTCKTVLIRSGRLLKAVCKGPHLDYALGGPQGDVSVTLATGASATNRKYCASFGPATTATILRDGSDGTVYKAVNAAVGVCP